MGKITLIKIAKIITVTVMFFSANVKEIKNYGKMIYYQSKILFMKFAGNELCSTVI